MRPCLRFFVYNYLPPVKLEESMRYDNYISGWSLKVALTLAY